MAKPGRTLVLLVALGWVAWAAAIPGVPSPGGAAGAGGAGGAGGEEGAEGVHPPQVILKTQKPPEYPPAALAARFTGTVVVQARILTDGTVGEIKVLDCDHKNLGFEDAAMAAVRGWRFEPAKRQDGEPVEYDAKFRLNFHGTGSGAGFQPVVSAGAAPPEEDSDEQRAERDRGRSAAPATTPSSGGKRR